MVFVVLFVGAGASLKGQNVHNLGGLSSAGVSARSLSLGGKKAKLEQRRVPAVSATIAARGVYSTILIQCF